MAGKKSRGGFAAQPQTTTSIEGPLLEADRKIDETNSPQPQSQPQLQFPQQKSWSEESCDLPVALKEGAALQWEQGMRTPSTASSPATSFREVDSSPWVEADAACCSEYSPEARVMSEAGRWADMQDEEDPVLYMPYMPTATTFPSAASSFSACEWAMQPCVEVTASDPSPTVINLEAALTGSEELNSGWPQFGCPGPLIAYDYQYVMVPAGMPVMEVAPLVNNAPVPKFAPPPGPAPIVNEIYENGPPAQAPAADEQAEASWASRSWQTDYAEARAWSGRSKFNKPGRRRGGAAF
mmetsp:Transcript_19987/g.46512  ORF Transcript_19987/g.46512 Transcript_19987/m.46512 type:complete len:296 (-) Transcript_19987:293-1180(-)|eukprot:CAMPEP_0178389512 /NCGR_PEP_ID=MMETSP0689_2-20121128/10157_1 /TAXON_ID=160604 /ORGANISM="Amphidinium massartii, Strain CS-259" /LENGTH=295 /DNA_ID=CAMNT_0020009969 /DNA_START=19 /DNA_END=906 /DNA_ORIENTATION=-